MQQLAAAGALVDEGQLKQYHCPPLHHAAQAGCTTLVAALLQAGADPGNTTPQGYTVLHAAAVSGRREVVQQLVEALGPSRAAEVVNKLGRLQCGEQRVTPLHVAAHLGHLEVAMALVAAGADELIDGSCVEPLVVALAAGQSHLVPLLVTPTIVNEQYNGCRIRGGDRIECITPLHMAAVCPVPKVQEARPEEVPQLVAAAVRAVKALLAAGADTSVRNSLGRTPLAEAVECGHCEVVQVLLRHEVEQYKQQLEKHQHQHQHQQHPQQQQQQQQQQEQQKQKPSAASVLQEVGGKALITGDGRTWQLLMTQAAEILGEQGVHSLWHAFKQQLQQEVQQQQQQRQQKLLGCAPYQQAVKALDAWVSCWAAAAGQLATQRRQLVVLPA
jgi:ankyrin repeat protein